MDTNLRAWSTLQGEVSSLTTPSQFSPYHQTLLDYVRTEFETHDLFKQAFLESNRVKAEQAAALFSQIQPESNDVARLIRETGLQWAPSTNVRRGCCHRCCQPGEMRLPEVANVPSFT